MPDEAAPRKPLRIEILVNPDCPHLDETRAVIEQALADLPLPGGAEISWREVADEREAREIGFLGSPSVRVNGRDVSPAGTENRPRGYHCRTYLTREGPRPYPGVEDVRDALRRASSS